MNLLLSGEPFLARHASDDGLSPSRLRSALADGRVRRLLDRVYVDALAPDTRELRIRAVKLVAPAHAVVCDETATWVLGVDTYKPSDRHKLVPSLVVPHGTSRLRVDDAACRQAIVRESDIMEIDGLRITTALRTTSDLLRKQWRPFAMASADAMAHAGLVVQADVWDFVCELRGFRGAPQARNLASMIEYLAQSRGESWTRLRLMDAGFPRPEAQCPWIDAAGDQRYLDLAYKARMVAMEFDGQMYHSADNDRESDSKRRMLLGATGLRSVVARYEDIFGTDNAFEREVGNLIGTEPLERFW
ncbi:DUF559 domain-containing protein [soil metagenome]